MARAKSLLSAAVPAAEANQNEPQPEAAPAIERAAPRRNANAGRYHLGGYFDHDDPMAEAFRVLAARTRRKQQDLLGEAIGDLVAKYQAQEQFRK